MGVYYEVLRPADKNDLGVVGSDVAAVLNRLPPDGYVSAGELEEICGRDATSCALEWACEKGILHKTMQYSSVMDLESVRFWLAQLNPPQMKRFSLEKGTRCTYANALESFNRWLQGKKFSAMRGTGKRSARVEFTDVEELLRFCEDPEQGSLMVRRVARQYLTDLAISKHSLSTAVVRCAAVKSYFAVHDIQTDPRVDKRRHTVHDVRDSPGMGLFDLYKMMTVGCMDVMFRAIIMIKFQAGLDASTFADRFNFEAYPQIVRHLGIEDYEAWDLGRCPVPVRLVRVKTGTEYTTFLDRDAVSHLQDYLRWKESKEGRKHDPSEPLFVTRRGSPVGPNWISIKFSKAATNAGIQKRTSHRVYKIHSHEVRDLLKSTLLVSGCAQYAADHVLGHAPRDSYEKQSTLYPEKLREEYAKASKRLNIFTSIERHLRGEDCAGS
ncbi:MAG: tyrosine-type recombinase/integrase [Nitrosopumilaceae archaeon]|nr:tyrosine-type recombinase/integrase [Nitrosopumilaceae archaeon]